MPLLCMRPQAQALVGAVSAASALLAAATTAAAPGTSSPGMPLGAAAAPTTSTRSPRSPHASSSGRAATSTNGAPSTSTSPASALAAYGDLIRSLYACADRYFVFARETLLNSPALGPLVSWGAAVVGLREREPVAAALAFLTHVIAVTGAACVGNCMPMEEGRLCVA